MFKNILNQISPEASHSSHPQTTLIKTDIFDYFINFFRQDKPNPLHQNEIVEMFLNGPYTEQHFFTK